MGLALISTLGRNGGATFPPVAEHDQPTPAGKFVWHNLITRTRKPHVLLWNRF